MNRAIKFRAWDSQKRQMLTQGNAQKAGPLEDWTLFELVNTMMPVMQFTGLLDKKGSEIYEGDKLKTRYGEGVVIWHNPTTSFVVALENRDKPLLLIDSDQEVIGNIYERSLEGVER